MNAVLGSSPAPELGTGIWALTAQSQGSTFFGPGTPLAPVAQVQTEGRAFDFAASYNLQIKPKPYEGVTFQELRNISDGYDLLRLVIETRKDQIEKLTWDIKKRGHKIVKKGAAPDTRIEKIRNFLAYPDLERPFGTWIRMLCEDLFVLDAPTVYVRKTKGGSLYALEPIDGATIKRVLDPTGRTPMEGTAYQQIIKGVIAADYTRDELIYMPRNPRTHKAFGFGPVEQVITTVNIALHRQLHQLSYYTDGNSASLIFGVPKEWTPEQVNRFQKNWDNMLAGNAAQRAKSRFVPGEIKPYDTKEQALKDDMDEWLARIICFAFSISPTALVKDNNRATAQTVQKAALSEGLAPVMNWIKAFLDRIIRDVFDADDLEFVWSDEQSMEPLVRAQIDQADITSGVRTKNECREDRGLEPIPEPEEPPVPPSTPIPPPGNASTPQGQEAGSPATTDKQPKEAGSTVKLAKGAKKAVKPIKRARPAVLKLETKIQKITAKFFKSQLQPIAEMLHEALPESAEKLEKMSAEEVRQMLDKMHIDWHDLGDSLESVLAAIAQDGAAQGLLQVGSDVSSLLDQVNEKAVAWAETHAAELVTKLEDTTIKALRGDLSAAIELGMSVDEIKAVLREDYSFSGERAELIARTERAFADCAGNMISYRESGVVGGKEWVLGSEHDDQACDCEDNANAGAIGLDDDFPSGDDTAPAHPNCVCDVLPVLKDTEE